ncbi:hypothetical protein JCM10207_008725 [Rhodosporidiobolus poonsookiae]
MATPDGPTYPSSLSSLASGYYDGLVDRLTSALLPVLEPYLAPPTSSSSAPRRLLEISSGNGTHAALFAKTWSVDVQPTECDKWGCAQVDQTSRKEGVLRGSDAESVGAVEGEKNGKEGKGGVRSARALNVLNEEHWAGLEEALKDESGEKKAYDVVFGSNFLHMVPFPDGPQSLFARLPALVTPDAKLLIYGPFKSDEGFFSEADEQFDASIRARPDGSYFGLRSIHTLARLAAASESWELEERVAMPKGNWMLVFRRT